MLYKRKYTIEYDIKMQGKDNRMLNLLFEREGIYLGNTYDSEMLQNTQGIQTVTHTENLYGITLNGVKHGLTFEYGSDARKAQSQLVKIFPDDGLFPIDTITTKTEEKDLVGMRGECVVLSQWNEETERRELLTPHRENDSGFKPYDLFLDYNWYGSSFNLGDDTIVKVRFYPKMTCTKLEFEIQWNAERVARKDAIERRLVEKPLDLMSLIILKVETALQSQFGDDSINDTIVDCKFESINHTSSECSPDIIQMVKDAKNELKQLQQEEE